MVSKILKMGCKKKIVPLPNKIAKTLPKKKVQFGRPAKKVDPKPIC